MREVTEHSGGIAEDFASTAFMPYCTCGWSGGMHPSKPSAVTAWEAHADEGPPLLHADGPPPLPDDWCYYHNRSEPVGPDDIVCGECFHTFTPDELVEAWNALGTHKITDASQARSCPLCIHDF